jgi:hypothetical protein
MSQGTGLHSLKSLRYLVSSENNSELLQIVGRWGDDGQAISTACGKIPGAAEQGSEIAVSGK